MDKGAHFYRCDFQVHSPRDTQWSGEDVVTEDQRKEYAKDFIKACRDKSLDAVTITDHHDITFFKYIKEAASNELDENNNPIPQEKKIVVFPGMELTLGVPCQAIIIFDSDFPVDLLTTLYTALSITQTDVALNKHAQATRLDHINKLSDLCTQLNTRGYLRNRFIVLPNINESGSDTILRSGFHPFYKDMPCVGGYLDGNISQLGQGNIRIINGRDPNYGPKKLGIFQTSDSRSQDFAVLGQHSTYVKWAVPTAEAIRQACLARESRISQEIPLFPAVYVTSIDVSNSKFMGQIYLDLNSQYNAIIGGRGTGKSTILEYLRWGLCDQSPEYTSKEEDVPIYQEKRKKLIDKTLLPYDSTVQITFVKNDITHIVRRKSNTKEIFLKIGAGEFEICSEDDIRNLLPIQAYSQKQLSSVGVSVEELKRLIYSPIRQNLNELDVASKKLRSEIKSCYELIQRKRLLEKDIERNDLELKSLTEQVEGLRKGLKGLTEDDKKTISIHKQYESTEQIVEEWLANISSIRSSIEDLTKEIAGYSFNIPEDINLPAAEQKTLNKLQSEITGLFSEVNKIISSLESKLNQKGEAFKILNKSITDLNKKFSQHKAKYETAKQKSTSQEATLTQIQKIEDRLKEIRTALTEKKQSISKIGDPETKFNTLKEEWFKTHKSKADYLDSQCNALSSLSDNNLRASLRRGHETSDLEENLKKMISGANIRRDKIEDLCNRIKETADPVQEWVKILNELEEISFFDPSKDPSSPLPNTPVLTSIGFTSNDLRRMSEKLNSDNWIDLFLVRLDDLPIFEYQTRDGEYIDFSDASAGQQATALMHVLLNQEGPPLIIDQPEEDLDNQMVSDIAALIWQAKKKRQLLFTSHNANIVVNGDAELVVCCGYKITGDQSKGEIKKQGAIDIEGIRFEITNIMEGGEEAFKLRKEKYGF